MKTVVVHGTDEDKVAARIADFRSVAKERGWQLIQLDKTTISQLPQALSKSLFEEQTLVLAQEPGVLTSQVVDWLGRHTDTSGNFVVYKFGTIPATALKKLAPAKTEVYDLPKTIFSLLGLISKGNASKLISLIRGKLADESSEFVFALVAKQIRDMYWATLDDGLPYPQWRTTKLSAQAKSFTPGNLKLMIRDLAHMDYIAKTGEQAVLDSLDLFFLKYLN